MTSTASGASPLRTTVSEIGPQLLAGILGLNKTQADILSVVYKLADDENLLLCDTKDLKAILQFASENAAALESEYGRIAKQSVAAIVRAIVALEGEGADQFFGEPAINVADFFTTDPSGKGTINVLDSSSLINQPRLYSAFMLYLLSELFEVLPEVGDMDKPRVVFFFDEAHLLFDSASSELMEKIEQMIKLIRSKGVGVYFITQSPGDIPDAVASQLGQQDRARPACLHPGGAQGAESRGGILPGEPRLRHNGAARPTGHRRSRRLDAGRKGRARRGAACLGAAARKLYGPAGRRPARPGRQDLQPLPQIQRPPPTRTLPLNSWSAANSSRAQQEAGRKKRRSRPKKSASPPEKQADKELEKEQERERRALERGVRSVASTTAGTLGRQLGGILGSQFGSFGKKLGGNVGASIGRNLLGTLFKR